jgi:membrane protease YdiL (CAAX protease family)
MKKSGVFADVDGRLRNGWWIAIFFLILSVFVFALIFLAERNHFDISIWHQLVVIVAVSVICQWMRRQSFLEITGRMDRAWFRDLSVGAIIGALLMLLPAMILTLTGVVQWSVNTVSPRSIFFAMAGMLGVALAEEFLFRGFLFQRLIGGIGKWPAQLLIGALFLLTHLNNPAMSGVSKIIASINIFTASILFGITFIRTTRLAMPVAIHFMANIIQGSVLGFGVSGNHDESILAPEFKSDQVWMTGGSFGLEASIVGLAVVVVITAWCYRERRLDHLV